MKNDSERRFLTVPGHLPGEWLNVSKDRILEFTYADDLRSVQIVGMGLKTGFIIGLTAHDEKVGKDDNGVYWTKTDEATVRETINQLREL